MTIGVSSATAERSFSSLRRIKTYLRSTMTQERLSNLALLYIEQDITNQLWNVLEELVVIIAELFCSNYESILATPDMNINMTGQGFISAAAYAVS